MKETKKFMGSSAMTLCHVLDVSLKTAYLIIENPYQRLKLKDAYKISLFKGCTLLDVLMASRGVDHTGKEEE